MNLEFRVLGLTLLKILFLRKLIWCTNSSLSWLSAIFYKFCSSFSSSTGLTKVKQSLSLKKCLISLLIRFLVSTLSEVPFWDCKAFSKYSRWLIGLPILSSKRREKSLTTQRNEGKYLAISSGSHSPSTSDLICSSLERLIYMCYQTFWE